MSAKLVTKPRLLVVDDEEAVRTLCSTLLAMWGWEVVQARDGLEALDLLRQTAVSGVLLDVHMPRLRGDALLAWIVGNKPSVPVVMMSSEDEAIRERVVSLGARAFLPKPFGAQQFGRAIELLDGRNGTSHVCG